MKKIFLYELAEAKDTIFYLNISFAVLCLLGCIVLNVLELALLVIAIVLVFLNLASLLITALFAVFSYGWAVQMAKSGDLTLDEVVQLIYEKHPNF